MAVWQFIDTRSKMSALERANKILPLLTSVALSFPIALPAVLGYETNPAFLLAPLVAWALFAKWDAVAVAFVVAGVAGLVSILTAALLYPDGRLLKDILSLTLLMFSAGFFFLGRRTDLERFMKFAAVASAVFLIPLATRILITGAPVRLPIAGLLHYNAVWLNLPTFASFGVNSAVHLTVIQAAIVCAAILGSRQRWIVALSTIALGSAVLLIVGSESRSSILALCVIFTATAAYISRHRYLWRRSVLILVAIAVGLPLGTANTRDGQRATKLVAYVASAIKQALPSERGSGSLMPDKAAPSPDINKISSGRDINKISSGRIAILKLASREFLSSPVIGTGFSPFGRYERPPEGVLLTSTSHIYYLTIFWKGGLLFGIPFIVFIVLAFARNLRTRPWRISPETAMATIAVLTIFGPVSFTYDTPNVPAAGALAFFLLGAMETVRSHQTRNVT